MPRTAAAYLTLCNGRLTPEDCFRLGLVNRVVPRDEVPAAAEELARMICRNAPLAVQGAVRLYNLANAFPAALSAYAKQLDKDIAESDNGAEGAQAFAEKRRPQWSGR